MTIESIFQPVVSDLVHEEVKGQMGRLWLSFKNEEIWKEDIKLREATTINEVMLIKYFGYIRERNFHYVFTTNLYK